MDKKLQCKHIPDVPVLEFLRDLPSLPGHPDIKWNATWFDYAPRPRNSVMNAVPEGTPEKLVLGKMRMLIRRGLVDGCGCGCRGDFQLTEKGRKLLEEHKPPECSACFKRLTAEEIEWPSTICMDCLGDADGWGLGDHNE